MHLVDVDIFLLHESGLPSYNLPVMAQAGSAIPIKSLNYTEIYAVIVQKWSEKLATDTLESER